MLCLTSQPSARPVALPPLFENFPQELRERPQWVVWRYELRRDRWTKVPFVPFELRKASTTAPSTWRSFRAARACYEDRPDFFDGIAYIFSADDPYVGGDFDHCIDAAGQLGGFAAAHLPATYAETSPSGAGVKFIALAANLPTGRKTAQAEIYSRARMFCLTGRVLDQAHTIITHQQAAIDALLAALGSTKRSDGGNANGDRAALAASIPRSEWDAVNELVRSQGDRLLKRAEKAATPKRAEKATSSTDQQEETQLAVVLRGDYAAFHARWPHVGIYRADDTLDDSQVIAVAAYGLKPRGFTFPEFAAILHILYGKETTARKGLARWRQDIVALWHKAPTPRFAPQPKAQSPDGIYSVPSAPRGRAGDHAALVERLYTLLRDYRVGVDALVKTGELATSLGIDRRTVNTILGELRQAGRISTRRAGQYAGLVISFSDGIYSAGPIADQPTPAPEIAIEPPPLEETDAHVHTHRVSLQSTAADPSSDREPPAAPEPITTTTAPHTLEALAARYLVLRPAEIGKECVNPKTGRITYRRTAKHFAELVVEQYGCWYTCDAAIAAYQDERQRLKDLAQQEWDRFFAQLDSMSDAELIAYVGGRCRTEVRELARDGQPFDKHKYQARLRCANRQMARRRLVMPSRQTRIAQQARDDAERAAQALANLAPKQQRPIACQPVRYEQPVIVEPATVDYAAVAAGITGRLKARQEAAHG